MQALHIPHQQTTARCYTLPDRDYGLRVCDPWRIELEIPLLEMMWIRARGVRRSEGYPELETIYSGRVSVNSRPRIIESRAWAMTEDGVCTYGGGRWVVELPWEDAGDELRSKRNSALVVSGRGDELMLRVDDEERAYIRVAEEVWRLRDLRQAKPETVYLQGAGIKFDPTRSGVSVRSAIRDRYLCDLELPHTSRGLSWRDWASTASGRLYLAAGHQIYAGRLGGGLRLWTEVARDERICGHACNERGELWLVTTRGCIYGVSRRGRVYKIAEPTWGANPIPGGENLVTVDASGRRFTLSLWFRESGPHTYVFDIDQRCVYPVGREINRYAMCLEPWL